MLRIDNNLLAEVGLVNLPDSEKNSLLRHIYETLEMRVGIRLADQMSNEQLDEFERYFEAKDDAGAFKWLETNFPNYKEIVQEEFEKLKSEVAQSAPQILSSSTQQQAQAQPVASNSQPPVDPYAGQASPVPPPQSPSPMPPPPPPPPVTGDINMPTQPPQLNPFPAPNPANLPPAPTYPTNNPVAEPTPQAPLPNQPMPPFPNQQPPAGPGAPGSQF